MKLFRRSELPKLLERKLRDIEEGDPLFIARVRQHKEDYKKLGKKAHKNYKETLEKMSTPEELARRDALLDVIREGKHSPKEIINALKRVEKLRLKNPWRREHTLALLRDVPHPDNPLIIKFVKAHTAEKFPKRVRDEALLTLNISNLKRALHEIS